MNLETCRMCKSTNLKRFLDLGMHPPSDAFLNKDQLGKRERTFPLDVHLCEDCFQVQLGYVVPPELMFTKDYVYLSSISEMVRNHFAEFAKDVVKRFDAIGSLVIDIGGNDGTFLKQFKKFGTRVLNVDPSGAVKYAIKDGIDSVNDFFNEEVATEILKKCGKARIITGTNVFAHVNDLDDLLRGVNKLLEDDGVFVIESPYLVDLIKNLQFDTIYHEHLSYLAIRPMSKLFSRFDMEIMDVKRTDIHGGSIRVFVKRSEGKWKVESVVNDLVKLEDQMNLHKIDTYNEFAIKVRSLKRRLLSLLDDISSKGFKIVGYSAPAKGNTLLNYCKIGKDRIKYLVDKNPLKHNLYTPGMRIPVLPPEKLLEDKPDYVLILAWNFAEEIMNQLRERGFSGKYIIPIPELRII